MLSRRERLSREAFPAVAKGRGSASGRVSTPHLALVASTEAKGYAVVVAKEVARLSTTRHTLKRRIMAVLRTQALPPALIVYARKGAPALPYAELKAELEAGIREIA